MSNTLTKDKTSTKEGYKKTKLGWIPEGWETPEISDVFNFLRTSSFSRNQLNYKEESEIYYIHYGDIHATYKTPILDFEKIQTVPRLNDDVTLPANVDYLKDGDVIIADASEDYEGIGTAIELQNTNKKKVISGLHTFALRDREGKTVQGFRTYIFKNPLVKKALKTIATGSKVFGISKSNVQNFKIVLPPLPEQHKIAQILSTWNKAIALQEQLITQKQALKKGLMQDLLTGKKRFPGFIDEWEEVRLGDVCEIKRGAGSQYITYVDESDSNSIRLIRITDFLSKDSKYILRTKDTERFLLEEGDLLIAGTGATAGITFEVPREFNGLVFSYNAPRIRVIKKVKKGFLIYYLKSDIILRQQLGLFTGNAQPFLDTKAIKRFKILIPKLEEQQK
jgi:type I restriction enzyme S subunit